MDPLEETYARLQAARRELDRLRPLAAGSNEVAAELNRQHYVVAGLERQLVAMNGARPIPHGPSDCPYA
jgi:hypothetical protein